MDERQLVMPGDILSTTEEYLPGEGTYESGDDICAALAGEPHFDEDNKVASVVSRNKPAVPEIDDIVYGIITNINPKMATVSILTINGGNRQLAVEQRANLHVSEMAPGKNTKTKAMYKEMEIIRAKVTQATPSIQLTTLDPELGTIKAYCRRCREILQVKGQELWCAECDTKESRKMADNYGLAYADDIRNSRK